jgi:ABC-2 type transport system permease protein
VSPALVFAGVGALTSQLAATRRLATGLAAATLTLALLVRVTADTAAGAGWLRWATPLGWTEELRPFARPDAAALLPTVVSSALLLGIAGAIALRRDVGSGVLRSSDSSEAKLRLLSSPTALALRSERASLAAWLLGTGLFALIIGILSTSFSASDISASLRQEIRKLGGASITTPAGAIGFYYVFFVLTISLYGCSQVAAARAEESDELLETLLALPVGRARWLRGRLLLAAAGSCALALVAGLLTWVGAAAEHAHVGLPRMAEAGVNCLPAALLFLALATLAYALAPRAASAIGYGLVGTAFLWELLGGLLGAPHWLVEATPFAHIGLVPAEPFRAVGAAVMLALACLAALAAQEAFRRRDIVGN